MPRFSNDQLDGMARELADRIAPSLAMHLKNSVKCCPNCENFDGGAIEKCRLNNMRPPATVIAFGCECFKDNELPF